MGGPELQAPLQTAALVPEDPDLLHSLRSRKPQTSEFNQLLLLSEAFQVFPNGISPSRIRFPYLSAPHPRPK